VAAEEQHEFWEGGGVYRPCHHPVVELFARQRVRYLTESGLLAGVRTLLDVSAGNGFSSSYYGEGVRLRLPIRSDSAIEGWRSCSTLSSFEKAATSRPTFPKFKPRPTAGVNRSRE